VLGTAIALTIGWAIVLTRLSLRPMRKQPLSAWTQIQEVLDQSRAETIGQLAAAREEMDRVCDLQAEAVHTLCTRLEEISEQAESQQRIAACPPARHGPDLDGGSDSLGVQCGEVTPELRSLLDTARGCRNAAKEVATELATVTRQVAALGDLLEGSEAVAKQANLLALRIAADQHGGTNPQPRVSAIADESRQIANRANRVWLRLASEVRDVERSLSVAARTLGQSVAAFPDTDAVTEQRIRTMALGSSSSRSTTAQALKQFEQAAATIADHVSAAMVLLQFQDITSQLLGHVERRFSATEGLIEELVTLAGLAVSESVPRRDPVPDGLKAGHGRLATAVVRARQLGGACPVAQTDMNAGAVELF
jgi:methyl-accepting chemotaxis protein